MERLIRWIPATIWMGIIFYLSHQSGDELGSLLPIFQIIAPWMQSFNWGHFIAYFILACTYYIALGPSAYHLKGKLFVIVLCLLYGITDEFHQSFVPNRSPDLLDLRNDVTGAALAMLFVSLKPVHQLLQKPFGRKY